ncbi:MAG: hypothetical protein ACI86H_002406 [bacterium]|jgi:hypothetical protein
MKTVIQFLKLLNFRTILITIVSLALTYLCIRLNLNANMPFGLVSAAVIFPIVFSINSAYQRREEALKFFAVTRANVVAVFFSHRDWGNREEVEDMLGVLQLIEELLTQIRIYLSNKKETNSSHLTKVYSIFSKISLSHEKLRKAGASDVEISRANENLRRLMVAFEQMKNIADYRTPRALRIFSQFFLSTLPLIYTPYFAYLASNNFISIGYAISILYSVALVSLGRVQEELENPYDGIGEDDIDLDILSDYRTALLPLIQKS